MKILIYSIYSRIVSQPVLMTCDVVLYCNILITWRLHRGLIRKTYSRPIGDTEKFIGVPVDNSRYWLTLRRLFLVRRLIRSYRNNIKVKRLNVTVERS
jgi:hypothetical protein